MPTPDSDHAIAIPSLDDLRTAFAATRAYTVETPLIEAPELARRIGAARAFVKAESLQRAGSFKIRGALWRLINLAPEQRTRGVVAYSSGNFAQGLAMAGSLMGVAVTIVMPIDAPAVKQARTRELGARVVPSDHAGRPREEAAGELARSIAAAEGLALLHPFDDPLIVAGQAGAALEAMEQLARVGAAADVVACCAGGGGLVAGVSLAFHYLSPATRVFAAEPEGYDSLGESLRRESRTRVAAGSATVCDALQATLTGEAPFAAARLAGTRGVAVGDAAVVAAMRRTFEELKLVVEPSGAAALAALESGLVEVAGKTVLAFATGGNVSFESFAAAVGRAA